MKKLTLSDSLKKRPQSYRKPETPKSMNFKDLKSYEPTPAKTEASKRDDKRIQSSTFYHMSTEPYLSSLTDRGSTGFHTKTKTFTRSSRSNKNKFIDVYSLTSSNEKDYSDAESYISKINNEIVLPLQKEIQSQNQISMDLSKEVSVYEDNLSNVRKDLTQTDRFKSDLYKSTRHSTIEMNRIKAENDFMEQEIYNVKKENLATQEKINKLNKEKVIMTNDYETMKEEVDSMKNEIKNLSVTIGQLMNEKKVMTSAFLLLQKKIAEVKQNVFLYKKQGGTTASNLKSIFNTFKLGNKIVARGVINYTE